MLHVESFHCCICGSGGGGGVRLFHKSSTEVVSAVKRWSSFDCPVHTLTVKNLILWSGVTPYT